MCNNLWQIYLIARNTHTHRYGQPTQRIIKNVFANMKMRQLFRCRRRRRRLRRCRRPLATSALLEFT